MIRAGCGRVVAMVGGENQYVIIGQGVYNLGQAPVKLDQRIGIPFRIVAVTKFSIKIDQIRKD
jgi:hypothetical protein